MEVKGQTTSLEEVALTRAYALKQNDAASGFYSGGSRLKDLFLLSEVYF